MAENEVWLLVGLFCVSIPLVAIARRANVAYPILLVLGGIAIGYVPHVPIPHLDPNVVLFIFLPPLLYWQAITAPTDVMRANITQIAVLAIGIVLATAFTVALAMHAVNPALTFGAAFVLGAIVGPTDELAASPVLERLKMPRHLVAIVQGESLINDAAGLIVYSVAVAAVVTGTFRLQSALLQFAIATIGAVIVGAILARVASVVWARLIDAQLQGVVSFVLPFLAYLIASRVSASGVLAVVTAGVRVNRLAPRVLTPAARVQGTGYWETAVFLANALLFLMMGMQVKELTGTIFQRYAWQTVLLYVVVLNGTIIATRFLWIFAQEYAPIVGSASEHPRPDPRHAFVAAWSGLRGAVSLAAALALPTSVPDRDLIVFLTFTVIIVTLVFGGATLPFVVSRMASRENADEAEEGVRRAVNAMTKSALDELQNIEREGKIPKDHVQRLRRRYEARREAVREPPGEAGDVRQAERRLLAAERGALLDLRDRREIDNTVMRELQRALDVSQEQLERETP